MSKLMGTVSDLEITPYMALLSIYTILLYKLTKQTDLIIGVPVTGRNQRTADLIGMFVNTIAIRNMFSSTSTFKDIINMTKLNLIEAYSNQDYPLELIVEKLKVKVDPSRSPLFETLFIMQSYVVKDVVQQFNSTNEVLGNTKTILL